MSKRQTASASCLGRSNGAQEAEDSRLLTEVGVLAQQSSQTPYHSAGAAAAAAALQGHLVPAAKLADA